MHRAFLSFLIAATLFVTASFAGMVFFGMHDQMGMSSMVDAGCIDRCLSSVPVLTLTSTVAVAVGFGLVVAILCLEVLASVGAFVTSQSRWRTGIGKYLRHQNLSTVMLRN